MKKETKELVKWIATQINLASHLDQSYHITKQAEIVHNEMENKAYDFLDSLPDIEKKLCFGGYIQDKNETPCCHGDNLKCVLIKNPKEDWFYGKLVWNTALGSFQILTQTNTYAISDMSWFEKVEE